MDDVQNQIDSLLNKYNICNDDIDDLKKSPDNARKLSVDSVEVVNDEIIFIDDDKDSDITEETVTNLHYNDEEKNDINKIIPGQKPDTAKNVIGEKKTTKRKMKVDKDLVKEKRKMLIENEKLLKNAIKIVNNNKKPDQCMKLINVIIDQNILKEDFFTSIKEQLDTAEIIFKVKEQAIPMTITWVRTIETVSEDMSGKPIIEKNYETTKEILLFINWNELVQLVHDEMLLPHLQKLKSLYPNNLLFLALFGVENYFKYQKKTHKKYEKTYGHAPKISKKQLELALTEVQLLYSICYRFIEYNNDMGQIVVQISKSIAQAPFKQEKNKRHEQMDWFMANDNRDSVHIDKEGNGLRRLWTQQLTTFPYARLETAEAVTSLYKTPSKLINEYDKATHNEGQRLLKEIPIRRAAGTVTASKKIGIEFSKKLHTFFTSTIGDELL